MVGREQPSFFQSTAQKGTRWDRVVRTRVMQHALDGHNVNVVASFVLALL